MIKCEVEVCATITRAASIKETKDGKSFLSFGVQLPIVGKDGARKDLELGVSVDGGKGEKSNYTVGRKVNLLGILTIRKKDGTTYFNLRANGGAEVCKSSEASKIEGSMEFMGKIGKNGVETHTNKKGSEYKTFSAFSCDKYDDKAEFTWVRFFYFKPKDGEDFLKDNTYVKVKGKLQFGVFRDNVSLDCVVEEVSPWELKTKKEG